MRRMHVAATIACCCRLLRQRLAPSSPSPGRQPEKCAPSVHLGQLDEVRPLDAAEAHDLLVRELRVGEVREDFLQPAGAFAFVFLVAVKLEIKCKEKRGQFGC